MLRVTMVGALVVVLALADAVLAPVVAVAGVAPDLTVLAVVGVALADGPGAGMRTGFAAGLLRDLLAPPTALVGSWALAFVVVGYTTGSVRGYVDPDSLSGQVVLGGPAAAAAMLLTGLLAGALGRSAGGLDEVLVATLVRGGYGIVLAPLIVRPIRSLMLHTSPAAPA